MGDLNAELRERTTPFPDREAELENRVRRVEKTLDLLFNHRERDVLEQAYEAFTFWRETSNRP